MHPSQPGPAGTPAGSAAPAPPADRHHRAERARPQPTDRLSRAGRVWLAVLTVGAVGAATLAVTSAGAGAALAAGVGNPLAGYTSWNVVSFGDVTIHAESEGAVAAAGNLAFSGSNVTLHDTGNPVGLLLGGGVDWAHSTGSLKVLNNATVKIGDMSASTALDTDANNASVNTQVVPAGSAYGSSPAVATTVHQAPSDVSAAGLFDSTFSLAAARASADSVAAAATGSCNSGAVITPTISGTSATVSLGSGTNYWNISAADLSALRQITFTGSGPSPDNPLVVNVTGGGSLTLDLVMAGARDPKGILFNGPGLTSIVQSGDSIDGSVLAPDAAYSKLSANAQGTLVVGSADLAGSEEHYYPFLGTVSPCTPTTTTTTTAPTTTAPTTTAPTTTAPTSDPTTTAPTTTAPTSDPTSTDPATSNPTSTAGSAVGSATASGPLASTGGTVVATRGAWLPFALLLVAGLLLGLGVLLARGRIRLTRR